MTRQPADLRYLGAFDLDAGLTSADREVRCGIGAGSPSKRPSKLENMAPSLSPSPKFTEVRKKSADDSILRDGPTTPMRPALQARGLSLQMPPKELFAPGSAYARVPLSPKLQTVETYGSPVIPRRSRGLDFSRAATNLHHSTLAERSSPDSSPTLTGKAMNIPGRRQSSLFSDVSSHWPSRPSGDRKTVSSSLGSVNMLCSDSSSSSSDEDMDVDDIDDSILTTPQIGSRAPVGLNIWTQPHASPGNSWTHQSHAASSLIKFRRARLRNTKPKKGSSSSSSMASPMSRSPPVPSTEAMNSSSFAKDPPPRPKSRRESISWAANQLHIDGSESDDGALRSTLEKNPENLPTTPARDGQRGVVKRAVTRRGNMLPKTKGFARIRAALAEESTPVETEVRREATVIRQVRENDMDVEPNRPRALSAIQSSPTAGACQGDAMDDVPNDDVLETSRTRSDSDFGAQATQNGEGKEFWEGFEERNPQCPLPPFLARHSTSTASDDMLMDSLSQISGGFSISQPIGGTTEPIFQVPSRATTPVPSAIDIRRVNNKRRRDDDFDPMSFKRRAVSPGMSVQNSPVTQSPMQRDVNPWGTRPPSNSGSDKGLFETGQLTGGRTNGTKRVGLQGMTDTYDGMMKMSIE